MSCSTHGFVGAGVLASLMLLGETAALAQPQYAWRYYRPGNTGIQGDYCDALYIGPDNDPWIGGYDPGFEEGGLAKFVQAENRWINVSNVDYPEIGHPQSTGTTRVRDITPDAAGNLWMGTGRGVLKFNPALGPSSLKRYDAGNSPWPGGWVTNVEIAPDGTIWASGYSTVWGGGGLMRFNPATSQWTFLGTARPEMLAVQPKTGGGYYLWAAPGTGNAGAVMRYNSSTQSWTTFPATSGNPASLAGSKCVDSAGNLWIHRILPDNVNTVLDCKRPDGSWIGVPPPPGGSVSLLRAIGPLQALAVAAGQVWRFDGAAWIPLGDWGNSNWTYDLGIDSTGAVWACGVGGAAKRHPLTGQWQRYRITNTSQFDSFNEDLSIDGSGVWACANAGPGVGGITTFDGERWTGFNALTYGLGEPWPFPTDNAQAIYRRPSNGDIIANPTFNGTSSLADGLWTAMPGGSGKVIQYVEDSLGRLWQLGEYFSLSRWTGSTWNNVGIAAWGSQLRIDPDRPGTIWAHAGYEVVRTDGTYRFSRTIDDFPELTSQSDTIWGMAVGRDGVAWLGCSVYLGAGGTGGGLIRLDANTGDYSIITHEAGWSLPGAYVTPWVVTPDGRVWMTYTNTYQYFDGGLCWYDGTNVGTFPGPIDGAAQWGGLPHTQVKDVEVKLIPGGYELWMSCLSRGIAVLTVTGTLPDTCPADFSGDGFVDDTDFVAFASAYEAFTVPPALPAADLNSDGFVDDADFVLFASAYEAFVCP